MSGDGFLTNVEFLQPIVALIEKNTRVSGMLGAIVTPFLILIAFELLGKKEDPGWARAQNAKRVFHEQPVVEVDTMPGKMVAISLGAIALLMGLLAIFYQQEAGILALVSIVLFAIGGTLYVFLHQADKSRRTSVLIDK
ncbi:MAG TPA: hypothetical protein DIV79_02935 [Opitutae bacterium]|nr:hypothetical protein [Opitutae bacterium]